MKDREYPLRASTGPMYEAGEESPKGGTQPSFPANRNMNMVAITKLGIVTPRVAVNITK